MLFSDKKDIYWSGPQNILRQQFPKFTLEELAKPGATTDKLIGLMKIEKSNSRCLSLRWTHIKSYFFRASAP